jgi:hypothetical protein
MSTTGTDRRNRSRVTNHPAVGRYGPSGRANARRVRDLYRAHLAQIGKGPFDPLTEARALRAAELEVICEDLRAKALAGEPFDPNAITRLESTANRAERSLIDAAPADTTADNELQEILSSVRGPAPRYEDDANG